MERLYLNLTLGMCFIVLVALGLIGLLIRSTAKLYTNPKWSRKRLLIGVGLFTLAVLLVVGAEFAYVEYAAWRIVSTLSNL